jgi:phthiocerol/phenolphthiocerol synthesis type-I polyketide synthase E
MADSSFPPHAIAIVGLGGRFPGATDLEQFWRNLMDGVDVLQAFSDDDLAEAGVPEALRKNPAYVRAGTVLEGVESFDAGFFGLSPREAQVLDPQQRIFLECAWEALEHAGYIRDPQDRTVGVYAGVGINTYLLHNIMTDRALVDTVGGYQLMLASDKDFLSTRVSYKLNLRGPSMSVQTACSTSLVAVIQACRALERGECDMALAGGVAVAFPQRAGYLYQEGMILSPDGLCRPFDAEARGTRGGAGAGIVVLKRLADAIADRDTIHAVIRGAAVNNDGAAKAGYTAPSIEGQVEVIATAIALADVPARSIGLVEAHGTGTPLGDPIEIAALTAVYRTDTDDVGFCRLGSAKANLGHLDAAAGVVGLIKATLSIENNAIPPLVHFNTPNPALMLETSPFAAGASPMAWPKDGPRRAGVSSFGIGGTNAHVIIEQAPLAPASAPSRDARLLLLSARTREGLDAAAANLSSWIKVHPEQNLADVEWTLQVGRRDFPHRRAVVVGEGDDAAAMLAAREGQNGIHDGGERPVVFMCSGQGSQHAEMGAGLYRFESAYREAFDACAEGLKPHLNLDLREIVLGGDGSTLEQTALAQPALFAMEYALGRLWMSWGLSPTAMIGHSIGEYVAACLAGVFSLDDALKIVAARGRAMQDCPPGAMAAVSMAQAALSVLLPAGIEIAAENGPELCAVAGPAKAVDALVAKLAASGVEARRLHVSHAFHSGMMAPALGPFRSAFEGVTLNPPLTPYISTLTGDWITDAEATSPDYYVRHLRGSVRFALGLRTIGVAHPAAAYIEVGPSTVLSSLARASVPQGSAARVVASARHPKDGRNDTEAMLLAVGRLWLMGALAEPAMINREASLRRTPLPTYPFERQRHWVDPRPVANTLDAPAIYDEPKAFAVTWSRSEAAPPGGTAVSGRWLVVGGPEDLRHATLTRLRAAGATAEAIAAGAPVENPASVAGAVALFPLEHSGLDQAADVYCDIVSLGQSLETWDRATPARIIIVGAGLGHVLDELTSDPYGAVAAGPVLVLPRECPNLRLRHVDLDPRVWRGDVEAAARALVVEAAEGRHAMFVAWRRGRRFIRAAEALELPPSNLPIVPPGAVVLIPGGLGAIGSKLAVWLAGAAGAKVVLTSRKPSPEAAAKVLQEIAAAGGEGMVIAADVCDRAAMAEAVSRAESRFGRIEAVIHAAGGESSAATTFFKKESELDAVLAPKTAGLQVLVDLFRDHPLSLFAAMGSINGVLGAATLSDYCSANAVLDAFAESELVPAAWSRVLTVGWGPWRDIGMAARLLEEFADRAEFVAEHRRSQIPPDAALDMLQRLVASGRSHAVVAMADVLPFFDAEPLREVEPSAKVQHRSRDDASFTAPAEGHEAQIAEIWANLLGVEAVGATDNFFALGGHSLLATRVIARIDEQLGVQLRLRDIFEAPTVRMIAERIAAAQDVDREEFVL